MRYSYLMAALAAPVVIAAPAKRQGSNIDTTVLQFALTLEHLENVFYKQALQKFSQSDFLKAGYGANYYNNLRYIASDEEDHVKFLSAALVAAGQTPTAACTYNFPYTDVQSFITLSSILEGVGTSAYLGGAPLITNKDYLTVAGSILVTEALHTSLQRSAVNEIPFASPYGTPLDPTSVYTLASAFIKSCPPSNPTLPFTPFPSLALNTTAGTCEQVDCTPQQFQKRDGWEVAPVKPVEPKKPEGDKKDGPWFGKDGKPMPEGPWFDKDGKPCPDDGKYGGPWFDKDGKPKPDGPWFDKDGHQMPGYDNKPKPDYDNKPKPDGDKKDYPPYDKGGMPPATVTVTKYAPGGAPTATVTVTATAGWEGGNYAEPTGKPGPKPDKSTKNMPALNAGDKATFTAASAIPAGSFLTFVSGLTVTSVPASISGNNAVAAIPATAMGQTYVFVTKTAATGNKLDGSSILFGPAILEVKPAPPSIDFNQA